jgi:penicillin-binding protein 1B
MSGPGALKRFLCVVGGLIVVFAIVLGVWLFRLDRSIQIRFAEKRFAPPVEFYSAPQSLRAGSLFSSERLQSLLVGKNFRLRDFGQPIQSGDFSVWTAEQCMTLIGSVLTIYQPHADEPPLPLSRCIAFKNTAPNNRTEDPSAVQIVAFAVGDRVDGVFSGATPKPVDKVLIEPELFAEYYGETPILRKIVSLGETPTNCLNALLAIEDARFLEHNGVRVSGLLRAVLTNLRVGRKAQGGSTITQQLVKNYFLTDEKTLRRKITEIAMAFLVERHATKDEILETYINLIYMGQNGPFQVRGFAAAAEFYFGKPLGELGLDQCALLAAVLNSPGMYDPAKAPDKALKRRALVLDRMLELGQIDAGQAAAAKAAPLPIRSGRALTEPAPYFVQAVRREIAGRAIDESEGLRVYTTLNLRAQEAAQQAVRTGVDKLEKTYKQLTKLKAKGKSLEAALLASDPRTGAIEAMVGGRGFLATQFNRATDSHRQVGSIMKPFVYLTALESTAEDGKPYTPLTILHDQATTHKFEGQVWTPHNYEGTYNGDVPLFWALKESLNAATVNLGMAIGLGNIIDTARRLGVSSKILPLPSLTLGAFELSPMEVLEAYGALSQFGARIPLMMIWKIEDLNGRELMRNDQVAQQVVAPDTAAELVGVMKQTIFNGTGMLARLNGFTNPAAGKTGTTNDKKDAWFAGFTPYHTAVAWVGYDDNTPIELTGATGAGPLWTNYMKSYATTFPPDDFSWPQGVDLVTLSPEEQLSFGVPDRGQGHRALEPIQLVFKKGQAPNVENNSITGTIKSWFKFNH